MIRSRLNALASCVATALLVAACATSPLGRQQLILFPDRELDAMGAAAFGKLKLEAPRSQDAAANRYVECVADAVIRALPGQDPTAWEVALFADDQVNAFALPGRKIGVYRGLLGVAQTPDQLATVIGHEIAHVEARHANERVSTQYATEAGVRLVTVASGSSAQQRQLFGLLGVGAQVGVLLPFNRRQEQEADLIGLDYMATAGFDPEQSVALWRNMAAAAGAKPPEFLSTHPSSQTRINELRGRMPQALALYRAAVSAGRRPDCRAPALAP